MTRIESGAIKLHLEPEDIQDVIGTALEQLGKRIENHKIKVNVPMDFPLVPMDFTLMVQVLVNLLENAVKYSPENSTDRSLRDIDWMKRSASKIADRGAGHPVRRPDSHLRQILPSPTPGECQRYRAGSIHQQGNYRSASW